MRRHDEEGPSIPHQEEIRDLQTRKAREESRQREQSVMHELSIIENVVDTLYDFFENEPVRKVHSVTLCVGTVSGVVPRYLTDAWKWFVKKDDVFRDSELKIELLHAYTTCLDCGEEYDTVQYAKICPHCHSENTVLKTGNELYIKEIEAE